MGSQGQTFEVSERKGDGRLWRWDLGLEGFYVRFFLFTFQLLSERQAAIILKKMLISPFKTLLWLILSFSLLSSLPPFLPR